MEMAKGKFKKGAAKGKSKGQTKSNGGGRGGRAGRGRGGGGLDDADVETGLKEPLMNSDSLAGQKSAIDADYDSDEERDREVSMKNMEDMEGGDAEYDGSESEGQPSIAEPGANVKRDKDGKIKRSSKPPPGLWDQMLSVVGMGPDPDDGKWIELKQHNAATRKDIDKGALLVSVEILPKAMAEMKPAGVGRSEPNSNPVLEPPVGRIDWTKVS